MKTYNELFRENAELPEEAYRELRTGFISAFRDELVGRRLMPTLALPASTQSYAYDRIKSDPSMAAIVAKSAGFPYHEYDAERLTVAVPKIGWAFKIPREDFLAGVIQNQQVDFARRKIAEKEDSLIFDGDNDFGILGLMDFAGNTAGATADWAASATVIEIYNDVKNIVGLLMADKVAGPYNMVVNPLQWVALGKYDTTAQRTAEELVRRLVSDILVSYTVPDGTVLVMRTGPDIARLGVVEDLTVETPLYDADHQEYRGRAFERIVPIIYQYGSTANKSDAIATITSA